ncbi:spore germination protein [Alteribacillus sp. HJP-4]|uniref:spore germination protein n=1 Tax=Alteribacillus sp. HJP-4 TaxID=2775394 RepID=UPI0035CD3891
MNKVSSNLFKNRKYISDELAAEENFDVIELPLTHGDINMILFTVDGLSKDTAIIHIQKELADHADKIKNGSRVDKLLQSVLPYLELSTTNDLDETIDQVLAGPAALLIDGAEKVILIDTREYPVRSIAEPETEQIVRGAKDGFVETIVFNTALTRRRIRDRRLRMEHLTVGQRSKTDICISYMKDIANPHLVQEMKKAIENINIDGLPMADKTLEEYIFGHYMNPYPLVRYTERPDVAAAHLLEGHILLFVDGSPTVMITPVTFWHHLQHAEEYRQKPIIGTMHRFVRFTAVWASLFLLPLWFLYAEGLIDTPDVIHYIGEEKEGSVPLLIQFLVAETGIEMLRMAAIHTPTALATALGLVAAILIGQIAIDVGLFSPEVVLYLAVAAIGSFATPSYELSLANRLWRIIFLLCAAAAGLSGFIAAVTFWCILLIRLKPVHIPYFWPLIPFSFHSLGDIFKRKPIPLKSRRPQITTRVNEKK